MHEFVDRFSGQTETVEEDPVTMWLLVLIVFGVGAIGGAINALISDNGFVLPKSTAGILRPGFFGNMLIGGVAAAISWSLYGPLASLPIVSVGSRETPPAQGDLTLAAIGGAILVGVAGARWLSNEVDKALLRTAVAEVSNRTTPQLSLAFATQSPANVVEAARRVTQEATIFEPAAR
jgi:hypothetical protein